MTKALQQTRRFKPSASRARTGVVVICDLVEFTRFFNQPDIHEYIPRYLNTVFERVERCFFGGKFDWLLEKETEKPLSILPVHRKFLGDGFLYVWVALKSAADFTVGFRTALANRLWNFKTYFEKVNRIAAEELPVLDLPPTIRFGIARGTVHELSIENSASKEYIGVCLNLASRLQKYCPSLGFIASARLDLPKAVLVKHSYMRVIATKVRGFPKEIVIVDKKEFEDLTAEERDEFFEEL